ncbi:hypothetical protein K492DRAFT_135810 [Lichtheimia hyalospora FSU 10163]|nr:hypothetical protein K492DRAFT_135810 [Lichtheimia hyalospora FSU 10163]
MSHSPSLSFNCSWPSGQTVESNEIDSWELKASRRALRNLKTLLAGHHMLDLLKDQIEVADNYYKDIVAKSNGQFKESRIDIKVKGINMAQFDAWWKAWIADLQNPELKRKTFLDTFVPAHPEHYALPPYPNEAGVVETIGGHIARIRIQPCANPPDFVEKYGDPAYHQFPGIGTLDDGSIFCYLFHETRDIEEGCDFRLRILFPAASPELLIEEHAHHLAVEFRSFISTAFKWNQEQNKS